MYTDQLSTLLLWLLKMLSDLEWQQTKLGCLARGIYFLEPQYWYAVHHSQHEQSISAYVVIPQIIRDDQKDISHSNTYHKEMYW